MTTQVEDVRRRAEVKINEKTGMTRRSTHAEPMAYRIQVRGRLNRQWSDLLGGLSIDVVGEPDRQVTQLSGCVADQATLLGILNGLYDLGFPLISVEYLTQD